MPATQMANLLQALKEYYTEDADSLNDTTPILNWAESDVENVDMVGRYARHTIRYERHSGVGAIPISGGSLPTPGPTKRKDVKIPLRANVCVWQFEDSLKYALADRGGFISIMQAQEEVVRDMRRDMNRQLFGTSDGVIAATGVTSNSSTVVLATSTTATQLRHLSPAEGMVISIGTVANPVAVAQNLRINSVDVVNKTISVVDATTGAPVNVTTGTTNRIFRQGAGGASTYTGDINDGQKELTGLQTLVGTQTLYGIDPVTTPVWKSYVDSNGGTLRAVSETLINNAILATEVESGQRVEVLVTSPELMNSIVNLKGGQYRYTDTTTVRGGMQAIAWDLPSQFGSGPNASIGVFWERDCPANQIFGLSYGALKWYTMGSFHFLSDDGETLHLVPGTTLYELVGAWYAELAAAKRNCLFKVVDVQ